MNKVFLIGNLTKDPVSGEAGDTNYCKFSIAVPKRFKRDEVDFLNVIAWRKTAELCGKYLAKGRKVAIVGSIQTGSYEKDGQKRYTTDIVADEVEFLYNKSDSEEATPTQTPRPPRPASVSSMQPVDEEILPF